MSKHSGPRPVAWRTPSALVSVDGDRVRVEDDSGDVWTAAPADAECDGLALIMAAAVARGEQGHTSALSRVAAVLGADAPAGEADSQRRRLADALKMELGSWEWGQLLDTARALRVTNDGLLSERDRLRTELAEAREALAGKTMHDAAAEVVAPLRNDVASREAVKFRRDWLMVASPGAVVSEAIRMLREAADMQLSLREAMGLSAATTSPAAVVAEAVARLRVPPACIVEAPDAD